MIGPREFREAIRTVNVSYPIPFMLAGLLAFSMFCFALATAVSEPLSWVVVGTGVASATCAILLAAFSVLRRPELLRSERHTLTSRYFDLLGDSDMSEDQRESAERALLGYMGGNVSKKQVVRDAEERRDG